MRKILISSNSQARIYRVETTQGAATIVKESDNAFLLQTEAKMLAFLKPFIRVPDVIKCENGTLTMEYIPNDGSRSPLCETELAECLASLHAHSAEQFGFAYDTVIGPFRQCNPAHESWIAFYREARVLDFAAKAFDEGRINASMLRRIERCAADFDNLITEPERPALLHGDIWGGNVLTRNNHFAALIDPALYYGHYEVELAFIGMFHTFSDAFYKRYGEIHTIDTEFFGTRAPIYRIFPYLVHIRAFGSGYLGGLESILETFGY